MKSYPFTLYSYPNSPDSIAVETALTICKAKFTHRKLDEKKPMTNAFLSKSLFGKVPALTEYYADQEIFISETPAVLYFLGKRFKNSSLAINDLQLETHLLSWMSFFYSDFGGLILKASANPCQPENSEQILLLEQRLKLLDNHLSIRAFLVGDYSIADILATPYLDLVSKIPGLKLEAFPHLSSWHKRLFSRPDYQAVIKNKPSSWLTPEIC